MHIDADEGVEQRQPCARAPEKARKILGLLATRVLDELRPAITRAVEHAHRAKLDDNAELAKFATTLEKVCVDTVEAGLMTKDLALLVGADQKWLSTTGFLDKVDDNLKKATTA